MWAAYALAAAFVAALYITLTKTGLKAVHPTVVLPVQTALCLLVVSSAAWYGGRFGALAEIDRKGWGLLAASGVLTGVSSLLLFQALHAGPASRVIPLDRLSLVFTAVLAAVFLGEAITWRVGAGLVLMAVGAAVVASARTE